MEYERLLETKKIRLRALEPSDVELLYQWENNTEIWNVGSTITPFSRQTIRDFIESASQTDIYAAKQLRLMIDDKESGKTVGTIDLFEFDAHNRRAGIGIFVDEPFQQKQLATNALECLLTYCKSMLLLHQVYVDIPTDNSASIKLFTNAGFSEVGVKKDWLFCESKFKDVVVMQKIL